jgi:SAM-dependent methyltransferase
LSEAVIENQSRLNSVTYRDVMAGAPKHLRVVDLGCGPKKIAGAIGLDIYAYPGVDVVADLNKTPWPVEANSFDFINCSHVIEHVANPVDFLREVHRIAKSGATVRFATPHFSAVNSWIDPTHVRHLSAQWYQPLMKGEYLAAQTGVFELISTGVSFGKSLRSLIPKLMVKLRGLKHWEKHYAFVYPAMDIETELRVVK